MGTALLYNLSDADKRMKIKLIIIDTFDYSYSPRQPEYFYTGSHLDSFYYSPPTSDKIIETIFTPSPLLPLRSVS